MRTTALLLLAFAGCAQGPAPESDAHANLDPERDIYVEIRGREVQVTDLPGAEDAEALSPDGRWVAFVGGGTGIASVWVAPVPAPGDAPGKAVQLTNVGLQAQARQPGQAPEGFVPPPDQGRLRWADERTVVWTAAGVEHRVSLP